MGGSSAMLLGMPEVQKELGLSDKQKDQVEGLLEESRDAMQSVFGDFDFQEFQELSPEERDKRLAENTRKMEAANLATEKKVADVLDAKQVERLDQLRLQREGVGALGRPDVARQLGLSDEQQAKIREIQESARPRGPGGFGGFGGPDQSDEDRREMFERMRAQREKADADILAVLNEEQKTKWAEMKGDEFEFPRPAFGGMGGFGRGGMGRGGDRQRVRPPVKSREE
jgi:hypothetical protein